MILPIIIFIIGSFLMGLSKAVADRVQHIDIWNDSIFNTALETSFWGPKDKTWIRKDHNNKIINWLLHYPLVWITDVWHCANALGAVSFIPLFVGIKYSLMHIAILIVIFYITRTLTFNLFYHWILKKR